MWLLTKLARRHRVFIVEFSFLSGAFAFTLSKLKGTNSKVTLCTTWLSVAEDITRLNCSRVVDAVIQNTVRQEGRSKTSNAQRYGEV